MKKEALQNPEVLKKYAGLLNVILEAANEAGVKDPNKAIMCEDLGTLTNPTSAVMKNLGLGGLRVNEWASTSDSKHFYRGKNVQGPHWAVLGTHDNDSKLQWVKNFSYKDAKAQIDYLNKDMGLKLSYTDRYGIVNVRENNPHELIKYKVAELFAGPSKKVQLPFFDLYGFQNSYNKPGTCTSKYFAELSEKAAAGDKSKEVIQYRDNWSLRVPNNPKAAYYKQVEEGKALNMPEILSISIKSKFKNLNKTQKAIVDKLNEFAGILKEKTSTDKSSEAS